MARKASTRDAGIGLEWKERWGWWSQDGVLILAGTVLTFDVALASDTADELATWNLILDEVQETLFNQLEYGTETLVGVHWKEDAAQLPGSRARVLRAVIQGGLRVCKDLKQAWRCRALVGGRAAATLSGFFDTASSQHVQHVATQIERQIADVPPGTLTACRLEVPARWFGMEVAKPVALQPSSVWWHFASLFGAVKSVTLLPRQGGRTVSLRDTVYLLARFVSPDGASAMFEGLSERYLCNASIRNAGRIDFFPVHVTLGDHTLLRNSSGAGIATKQFAALPAGASMSSGGSSGSTAKPGGGPPPKFLLQRCGQGTVISGFQCKPPNVISLSAVQPKVIIGREAGCCHVVIPHPHVSKAHLSLLLEQQPNGSCMLILQDSSSNGTWVNGQRLSRGQALQLQPGDKISFLQPTVALHLDELSYELRLPPEEPAAGNLSSPTVSTSAGSSATPPAPPDAAGARAAGRGPREQSRSRSPRRSGAPDALQDAPAPALGSEAALRGGGKPGGATTAASAAHAATAASVDAMRGASAVSAGVAAVADGLDDMEEVDLTAALTSWAKDYEAADDRDDDVDSVDLMDEVAAVVDHFDGVAPLAAPLSPLPLPASADTFEEDISRWGLSLGLSAQTIENLCSICDNVSQICALYAGNLPGLYEDSHVEVRRDRQLLAAALPVHRSAQL
eukprot:TRINITY_DN74730_c0_g1_i1.p1 TRINITY_DN74730_c0_g1~~TRINITY_DN74730_c0_g1_i1.p1  ORF type:complete len:681 (+),score=147.55 TRINITY_DN74730_c0_g1_i1:147-2189(+)